MNPFVTIDEVSNYTLSDKWPNLEPQIQSRYIQKATAMLSPYLSPDGDVPEPVKVACFELIAHLLDQSGEFEKISIPGLEADYRTPDNQPIPDYVMDMIGPYMKPLRRSSKGM